MNKEEKPVTLPRGINPIEATKKIVVTTRKTAKPISTKANEAMVEAFKTYVHPGVLQLDNAEEE